MTRATWSGITSDGLPADAVLAEMARLLGEAVRGIDQALAYLGPTRTPPLTPPMRRSKRSEGSSALTTTVWPAYSTLRTAANGSLAESSIAAALGSATS